MSDPSSAAPAAAVIRAEPDAYDMAKQKLMGRQAAGHGFLRAAVQARGERPLYGLVSGSQVAKRFGEMVRAIDPAAAIETILNDQLDRVGDVGVLYLADITVATQARLRLRVGMDAFSFCGVTHTTASAGAMDELVGLLREPVAPWDALVCTSSAVVETVRQVFDAETDYLRWRFGDGVRIEPPQLPIIPLGVHCDDYQISAEARAKGREALGVDADEVTALFVGRLVFHAKAHPFAMFRGLQAAAERTGRKVGLILCGWAPNDSITEAFTSGAAAFAPDVNVRFVEGRDPILKGHAWAAADMFVSLSDNIQETFGLTPIEAMAAGLPVVVTDWNGYRDTVRPGLDGYRIKTWAPGPGMGAPLVRGYDNGTLSYDQYCWYAATTTSMDLEELTGALVDLVEKPELRRTLGESGRRRARELYDWPVVYRQYQALWADLNARRAAARRDPEIAARLARGPRGQAARLDPFQAFAHYPTAQIGPTTVLRASPGADRQTLRHALDHPLFSQLPAPPQLLEEIFALAVQADLTVAEATARLRSSIPAITRATGILAKVGAVMLG